MSAGFRLAALELEYSRIVREHLGLTFSVLGKRALVEELRPKTDPLAIDASMSEVQEMRQFLRGDEHPPFSGLDDIGVILRNAEIEGSTMYVEQGAQVLRVIKSMRMLREFFARRSKDAVALWRSAVHLFDDKLIEMHFASVFDDNGNVKDSASQELSRIRREIIHTAELLRTRLNAILRRLSEDDALQEELITQRDGRFVVPVKVEYKRKVPGLIHSVSQTGQTVFIEPTETLDLNNEMRSLEFAEQREIDRILRGLMDLLRESVPALTRSLAAAGHLEADYAKARYAEKYDCAVPRTTQQVKNRKRRVYLAGARHPLLLQKMGRAKTVPLEIELDEDRRVLILTGPNAGGKTVLLKTLGLLTMMAQAGIPIPANDDAELVIVDGVYVEIGDSQSIADDLSTFSSHVTALASILKHVTSESLVLLDEIGGGTAPEEGGAIAESILESLVRIRTFAVATTHYGRLAAFAESTQGTLNGSMEFDRAKLTPTFRFRSGVPGSSHAFEIAERFGLSKNVIDRARDLRGTGSTRFEELLASLEELQKEARERKGEADRELGKARILRSEFERKRDESEEIRRTIKSKAAQEAEEILKRANSFIEKAVRDAKEIASRSGGKSTSEEDHQLKEARLNQEIERKKLLESIKTTEKEEARKAAPPAKPITVGAKVRLRSNPDRIGEVLALRDGEAEVQIGIMKLRIAVDQLDLVAGSTAREEDRKRQTVNREVSVATKYLGEQFDTRIDLRGQYGDDAIIQVEKYLADAAAHGRDRVEIIHGIGTGALGRRISQHLKNHPLVLSYRYGEPQEGGSGVTIVEIK